MTFKTFKNADGYGIHRISDSATLCGEIAPVTWNDEALASQFAAHMNRHESDQDIQRDVLDARFLCLKQMEVA